MILQTFIISIRLWTNHSNSWLSLILFLIFIGGLIVLFVYIISLASNETFTLVSETNLITAHLFFMILIIYLFNINYNIIKQLNFNYFTQFNKIYSSSTRYIISFTIFYLLLVLIVVVKISNLKEAPVKNIFY